MDGAVTRLRAAAQHAHSSSRRMLKRLRSRPAASPSAGDAAMPEALNSAGSGRGATAGAAAGGAFTTTGGRFVPFAFPTAIGTEGGSTTSTSGASGTTGAIATAAAACTLVRVRFAAFGCTATPTSSSLAGTDAGAAATLGPIDFLLMISSARLAARSLMACWACADAFIFSGDCFMRLRKVCASAHGHNAEYVNV